MTLCSTQVHGLLRRVRGDAVEHDAGQHGAEQQGEAAGHSLNTGEGAAGRSADHRVPEVSVTQILCRLHKEQITGREKQQGEVVSKNNVIIPRELKLD